MPNMHEYFWSHGSWISSPTSMWDLTTGAAWVRKCVRKAGGNAPPRRAVKLTAPKRKQVAPMEAYGGPAQPSPTIANV
jgi:hypothetical protein